jgi:hypothetical protein
MKANVQKKNQTMSQKLLHIAISPSVRADRTVPAGAVTR